jgi:protein-S-isoprenylcysteine O-methyltransferase Ste14
MSTSLQLAPWIILLAVAIYGVVHSWLASLGVKAWARRRYGELAERLYRFTYNLFAALTLLPVLVLPALLPDRRLYSVPMPWALCLMVLQLLAVGALGVGLLQTGLWAFLGLKQLAGRREIGEDDQLVVSGLYRWVRHPLYTAGLVFLWATPVMTRNLLSLYVGLSAYLVIGAMFEERKLLATFGEAYARYRVRTPMLIPKLPFQRNESP